MNGYSYAAKLFDNAKHFDDYKAKVKTLKMAYNAAITENKYVLQSEIEDYAKKCGIDLSQVSGYDF
ncbi:MAG TPA: hypothetical protein DCW44_03985 [Eubacterium sp.]|nr:hypothetical protein [Eubacterium sp.]